MKKSTKLAVGILLAFTCLALAVTGSFAAYTRTRYAKRVVTTKAGTGGLPFSSNYLDPITNSGAYNEKVISVGKDTDLSIPLTICNYPRNEIAKYSNTKITYTLNIDLIGSEPVPNDLKAYLKIDNTPLSSWDYTSDHTLPGGSSHLDRYMITCNADSVETLSQYTIRITATSSIATLGADLKISPAGEQSTHWKGEWDEKEAGKDPDAFNYQIHGSAKETVTLTWDSAQVEIYAWFKDDLNAELGGRGSVTETTNGSRITYSFPVGLEGQSNSYRIQFYKIGSDIDMSTAVTFDFIQSSD